MNTPAKWTDLIALTIAVHERTLRMASKEAARPGAGTLEPIISGTDDSLAAIAILRGPAAGREFPPSVAPVVALIGRQIGMFRDGIADLSVLGLLSLVTISESVGAPLEMPAFDVDYRFKNFLANKQFSNAERVTVALLALHFGRKDDVRLIINSVGRGKVAPGNPVALVRALADALDSGKASVEVESAFDEFVRAFPSGLEADTAEWRQLMLGALLVLGKLGGNPLTEVAELVHRRVLNLASAESQ
jgi:hypothetical protein